MVDRMYAHGNAVSVASFFDIDDVIDPADTRRWITTIFDSAPETHRAATDPMAPPRRPNIDTW
jgi:acetyl-CoA carboxylase carboxyltransferase component